MFHYEFRDGPIFVVDPKKVSAQEVGEALEKVRVEHGGIFNAKRAARDAKDENHPLHRFLEWDDSVGAEKYRIHQCRQLARSILVRPIAEEPPKPAFINLTPAKNMRGYYNYDQVISSYQLQEATLKMAERDLEAFEKRYAVLADICEKVVEARRQVAERRKALREAYDTRQAEAAAGAA